MRKIAEDEYIEYEKLPSYIRKQKIKERLQRGKQIAERTGRGVMSVMGGLSNLGKEFMGETKSTRKRIKKMRSIGFLGEPLGGSTDFLGKSRPIRRSRKKQRRENLQKSYRQPVILLQGYQSPRYQQPIVKYRQPPKRKTKRRTSRRYQSNNNLGGFV